MNEFLFLLILDQMNLMRHAYPRSLKDDFDQLFDAYKKRKLKEREENDKTAPSEEDLQLWRDVRQAESAAAQCHICRKVLKDLDLVEACPNCHTYFHFRHWREWIKIKGICPICKK
ncbi:MAG: RING-H2 finger protein [Methanobacteriota archaeon]|nr:MAG: RING-H2 finger protein [Euryarchaeota archaeon]